MQMGVVFVRKECHGFQTLIANYQACTAVLAKGAAELQSNIIIIVALCQDCSPTSSSSLHYARTAVQQRVPDCMLAVLEACKVPSRWGCWPTKQFDVHDESRSWVCAAFFSVAHPPLPYPQACEGVQNSWRASPLEGGC